jgi:hypothetical protein
MAVGRCAELRLQCLCHPGFLRPASRFTWGHLCPARPGALISLPIDAQVTAPHGRPATVYFVAAFQPTDLPSPPILTGSCQSSTDYCLADVCGTPSIYSVSKARRSSRHGDVAPVRQWILVSCSLGLRPRMRDRKLIDTTQPNNAHSQLDTRTPASRPRRKRRGLHWMMMLLLPSIVVVVTLIAG